MELQPTPLPGVTLIRTAPVADGRGRFERIYCAQQLSQLLPGRPLAQMNLSLTHTRGTVRGLHYQRAPALEAKLVRCLQGRVFDVAVDLRAGSATFLQWFGVELDQDQATEVFIPEGFAHGFQTLTDDVQLLYLHSAPWSPEHEGGLRHDDPRVAIRWPLHVTAISPRDAGHPYLASDFRGLSA